MPAAFEIPGFAALMRCQRSDSLGIVRMRCQAPSCCRKWCSGGEGCAEELNAFVSVDFAGEVHPPLIATFSYCSVGELGYVDEWGKAICGIEYFCLFDD